MLVVTLMTITSALAQRTISGKVMEKDSQEAVIQATVALLKSDSTIVTNAITNMNGQFTMTAPKDGSYIVRITYVGFKPFTKRISVAGGKAVNLGTISLAPDAIMLKGTTVTAHLAKVQSKGDTLIYNADAYRTPEGSVVEELVKRMPGAEVDDEGNIKINGKSVTKVRVDGKEFGDTKTALKNLPTSIVERIKSYEEKSDLARITGIDDGNEQTVLDFGLRAGMNRGTMANADIAAGTKDRYSARLFGMYMRGDSRLMAMLNANNTNDMGWRQALRWRRWQFWIERHEVVDDKLQLREEKQTHSPGQRDVEPPRRRHLVAPCQRELPQHRYRLVFKLAEPELFSCQQLEHQRTHGVDARHTVEHQLQTQPCLYEQRRHWMEQLGNFQPGPIFQHWIQRCFARR